MELLHGPNDPCARLRALLARPEPLVAAGAFDALSARLVEATGFDAVYMTGFGTAASLLGRPDIGLLTLTEMVGNAARMVAAVGVPVIADADTGYGNPLNVIRTVQDYERAGVAGLHLEDQAAPKRCGHLAGKVLVPVEEHVARIRAAVAARTNPELVLIARTDARATEGLAPAIERARRYADAGADVLFVEAPHSEEEVEQVASELAGLPLLFNWVEGGKTPAIPLERLAALGYSLVIFPVSALLSAARAMRATLGSLRATGTSAAASDAGQLDDFADFVRFIGLPEINELETALRLLTGSPASDPPASCGRLSPSRPAEPEPAGRARAGRPRGLRRAAPGDRWESASKRCMVERNQLIRVVRMPDDRLTEDCFELAEVDIRDTRPGGAGLPHPVPLGRCRQPGVDAGRHLSRGAARRGDDGRRRHRRGGDLGGPELPRRLSGRSRAGVADHTRWSRPPPQ